VEAAEQQRLRREILDEIGPLFLEQLAGDAWGRALVEVARREGGQPVVVGIDVEEIVGDESRVEAVFGGDGARNALPLLAKATEALCALDGAELAQVRGGTYIRVERRFVWIPGLVRTPSARFDRERDGVVARLRDQNERVRARFAADRVELDVEGGMVSWLRQGRSVGRARATLLGTFAHGPRTWAWAWSNPSLSESVQRASAELTDALEERDLWEITTPAFATDEPTAWALAALICDRCAGEGVQRIACPDGALFVVLRGIDEA
jgi:hypothetical protein